MIEKDIDRDAHLKLYVKIYGVIKRMIEEKEWQPGGTIPSEDELTRMFAVSKTTVRLALAELVRDGYLRRHQGKGTFVKSPVPNPGITMKTRLSDGLVPDDSRWGRESLEAGAIEPDAEVRRYLRCEGTVFYAQCRISEDGQPACVEELFVPLAFFPGIEGEDICCTSFFALVRERSVRKLSKIIQTIDVARLNGPIARLLMVEEGHPALLVQRFFIDAEGRPVAYIRLYGASGKYQVRAEFEPIR